MAAAVYKIGMEPTTSGQHAKRAGWVGLLLAGIAVLLSLAAALSLPKGFALAAFGDSLQLGLVIAITLLVFQNFLRSRERVRIFWFLTFLGALLWTMSSTIWTLHELWLKRPVPDSAAIDILLFVKIVPLTAAFAASPHREQSSRFRTFGLLDVSVLMVYALYLYGFAVFSYRLLPGATEIYNVRFNIAEATGNLVFLLGAMAALLTSRAKWRAFYGVYFFSVASYCLASNLSNFAIDGGRYYTGSLYDIPLVAALGGLMCMALQGRALEDTELANAPAGEEEELPGRASFVSSHLAMLVVLSTPMIGFWLLSGTTAAPLLRFRLIMTLVTMFLLTLLLSIKEDLLNAGLVALLGRLSETYGSIERFKSRLSESEKMAALGNLVAEVANQIKECMTTILEVAAKLSCRPDTESRVQGMAGKIGQYAQRTDALVDNMLHFAQETPMRPAPLAIKPLLESALQLSRIAKLPDVRVSLTQEAECPLVCADSSQLLHVFLELISNAADALEEATGGTLEIKIVHADSYATIEFLDSGPGLKEPARVFEPFYTTKVVGKGTGLGLSTCYGILQQHQGEITCRNRPLGGACFTVRLPLAVQAAEPSKAALPVVMEGAS